MIDMLARAWRSLISPIPTPTDRTEQAVRVIQRHLDEASRRRGGSLVEARDLELAEREALARDLATVLGSAERARQIAGQPEGTSEPQQPSASA